MFFYVLYTKYRILFRTYPAFLQHLWKRILVLGVCLSFLPTLLSQAAAEYLEIHPAAKTMEANADNTNNDSTSGNVTMDGSCISF